LIQMKASKLKLYKQQLIIGIVLLIILMVQLIASGQKIAETPNPEYHSYMIVHNSGVAQQ